MSDKKNEDLKKRIDKLIKKNNELEKKVFNFLHNPNELSSDTYMSKKEKDLKKLQMQINQKQSELTKKENMLNMKEAELNQREMLLNKKESELIEKEANLQKPRIIIKEPMDKKKKIDDICSHLLNSKNISPKKLYEDMSTFGTILKKEIEEELKTNPEKFIEIDTELNNENSEFLPSAILAKNLQDNKILAVVEKEQKESPIYDIALQFLVNGMANEKKLVISYDFGKEKNDLIIYDEEEQKKFVEKELDKLEKILQVPRVYIHLCNFREGSVTFDANISIKFIQESKNENKEILEKPFVDPFINIDSNFDNLVNKLKEVSEANNAKISSVPLVEGIKLNSSLFDSRGNRNSGWPVGEKRGEMDYIPPLGWNGHGLRVSKKYDGGDDTWLGMDNSPGEWCVAYHGTNIKFAKSIIETNLRPGVNQYHKNCNNINSKCNLEKVGIGIYVSPLPNTAELYSTLTNHYKCMFMCRINPNKFRTCADTNKEYWVVDPTEEDIRPYRLLIKKIDE